MTVSSSLLSFPLISWWICCWYIRSGSVDHQVPRRSAATEESRRVYLRQASLPAAFESRGQDQAKKQVLSSFNTFISVFWTLFVALLVRFAIEKPHKQITTQHSGVWEVGKDGRLIFTGFINFLSLISFPSSIVDRMKILLRNSHISLV